MKKTARPRLRALAAAALASTALGGLPAAASAVVSTGHSGWAWTNPSPQGEDIGDVSFVGGNGYAVGGYGTLLRSNDSGQTWVGLPSTTVQNLTRVMSVGEAGFVTAGGCAVRRSTDGGATIASIDVGGGDQGCGTAVRAVAFSDPMNGLVVFENGIVLATADGGVSLARRTPVPGLPTDVVATAVGTAYSTSNDSIYRTTDAGNSWTLVAQTPRSTVPFVPPRTLRSITFPSATVGYAVGDAGTVMKTIDGGVTWAAVPPPAPALDLQRVRCADENLCLMTTTAGATLVRTADGGTTFTQVTAAGSPIRGVAFASPTRAIAAGAGGVTVVSDDGGATWHPVGTSFTSELTSIVARPGAFGYGVGLNTIALTGNGGESWTTFGIPTPLSIQVAAFVDPLTGYSQDSGGTLRRTANGGATWQVLDPGPASGLYQDIVPLSAGRVLVITPTRIGRSTDGGQSFSLVDDRALTRSRVIRDGIHKTVSGGSRVFIIGKRGILRSADAGLRWTELPLPSATGRPPTIAVADCAVPATCWIVTTGSRMYRTSNYGRRWVDVTPSVGLPMRNVRRLALGSPSEAFLALQGSGSLLAINGVVLHTGDNGATWAPQLLEAQPLTALDAVPGRAWALAGTTRALTTVSGGSVGVASTLTIRPSTRRFTRVPSVVTITGRLTDARGGEQVALHATGFPARTITVSSGGSFTALYRLRRTTTFVAQWAGDGVRDGDGTLPLVVERRPAP
jgi:photosystem II stability/assembly factor-like uncharacterized protein